MKAAAPDGPKGTFGAADWDKIKRSLASIGVDLSTARINADIEARSTAAYPCSVGGRVEVRSAIVYPYSSRNHPWLSVGPEWRLSEALQRLAWFYTLPSPPTAKRRADELEDVCKALTRAHTKLRSAERERHFNYPDNPPRDIAKDRALDELLVSKIAELRGRVIGLRAIGSSSSQSRLTVQGKYWRELRSLWLACGDNRLHEGALREFLSACSRAPFLEMRAAVREEKIDTFLSHSRKRKAQTAT